MTIEVRGNRFTSNTQVQLIAGETTRAAVSVDVRDSTQLFATFDLTDEVIGQYDVRATDGLAIATLPAAFTVVEGVSNPIDVRLITLGAIRQGRVSSVLIEYTNTGNTDVVAPVIEALGDERETAAGGSVGFRGELH